MARCDSSTFYKSPIISNYASLPVTTTSKTGSKIGVTPPCGQAPSNHLQIVFWNLIKEPSTNAPHYYLSLYSVSCEIPFTTRGWTALNLVRFLVRLGSMRLIPFLCVKSYIYIIGLCLTRDKKKRIHLFNSELLDKL